MTEVPRVRDYMTAVLHAVDPEDVVSTARDLMHAHGIRHLPVHSDNKCVGIVTWSDVFVVESFLSADADEIKVGDVMTESVTMVAPDTSVAAAARMMRDQHIGSLVIIADEKLCGLFTATDAVRALADLAPDR